MGKFIFNKPLTMLLYVALLMSTRFVDSVVNWHDNLNITTDVIDQNIDVSGTNQITKSGGHLIVSAVNQDVVVAINTNDSVITSSLQLHLSAALGRTITFSVTNDLLFRGSQSDFLITFSGAGNLVFETKGQALKKGVRFSSLPTTGGATFLQVMNYPVNGNVIFQRFPVGSFAAPEPNLNAYVQVGPASVISFGSQNSITSGDFGTIQFNASNLTSATGRLALLVENASSLIVAGSELLNAFTAPTLAGWNFNVPAGTNASFEVLSNPSVDIWNGLLVVNNNLTWGPLQIDPFCEDNYTAVRQGFVLGANGKLIIDDQAYFDYVTTVTNVSLNPNIPASVLDHRPVWSTIKDRNPAALIIDGSTDQLAIPASINLNGTGALYFRSGVNDDGISTFTVLDTSLSPDPIISFTINPDENLNNEGTTVLDVEGILNVFGGTESAMQVLSLYVSQTGGSVLINSSDVLFPLRTFLTDSNGAYLQYGSANFLMNNRMNLFNMHLQHMDQIHAVYEDNLKAQSSPTYVGGDRPSLSIGDDPTCLCSTRSIVNAIAFYNSFFDVHTDLALTGISLNIPGLVSEGSESNNSAFVFYTNGRCIDNGTGRMFIMGTEVGSQASDGDTIIPGPNGEAIGRDAQLDIMQEVAQGGGVDLILTMSTSQNNSKVTQGITGSILNQPPVHTLFLAHASNISIGTNGATGTDAQGQPFPLTLFPTLLVGGDFFSFMTQGGTVHKPELSMTTGEGGMFVDANGVVSVPSTYRSNFGMMVTMSRNGVIDLPKSRVFFDPRVGTSYWQLNLGDPNQLQIVGPGARLSQYTMDWQNLTKDFCATPAFVPYEPTATPLPGQSPAVVNANLINLPYVSGEVDQFQIVNSRLGDQAHLLVDGGTIRELVLMTGQASSTAPVGVLVLQNDALVGFGTAQRSSNSLDASAVLGINGLILMPNGDATVRLNVNTIIDNVCHIVTGTLFGTSGPNRLLIDSVVPTELRVKSDGVLDLTQFTNINQTLTIGGGVNLVLEPGAQVLLGGGNLIFAGNSQLYCEPFTNLAGLIGTQITSTDPYRVRFIGTGNVVISENSQAFIPRDAILGIETINEGGVVIQTTNQNWTLQDDGKLLIGSEAQFGGTLQIGDTVNQGAGYSVTFNLNINGTGALLDIDSQGFLGLGAGIANKPNGSPNNWVVNTLFDVNAITILVNNGTFQHKQIQSGTSSLASLLGIGNTSASISFAFDDINAAILGGGNIALLSSQISAYSPIITTEDGPSGNLSAGIMSSRPTLQDVSKLAQRALVLSTPTPTNLYIFLKMNAFGDQTGKTAAIYRSALGSNTIGFVNGTTITRNPAQGIQGLGGAYVGATNALSIGAVGISNPTNGVLSELNPAS